jgi:hypothetical protein
MKIIKWYCYQLNEKRNKLGNPYFGKTKNLVTRAIRWQKTLELDYIPELIIIKEDTCEQKIFDFEQERRVENGWRRERDLQHQIKTRQKGGIASGKKAASNGQLDRARANSIHINRKITDEQIKELKKFYKRGVNGFGVGQTAKKFNISDTLVRFIVSGKRHGDII